MKKIIKLINFASEWLLCNKKIILAHKILKNTNSVHYSQQNYIFPLASSKETTVQISFQQQQFRTLFKQSLKKSSQICGKQS